VGKKKKTTQQSRHFSSSPFSSLKGLSASDEKKTVREDVPRPENPPQPVPEISAEELFAREMAMLGVQRAGPDDSEGEQRSPATELRPLAHEDEPRSEEDQFLAALGEMDVRFEDSWGAQESLPQAQPRRARQLKRGQLQPEATLDLHGSFRYQVVDRVRFFLDDMKRQGCQVVLIITGRGLHSAGEPVVRNEVERVLRDELRASVVEWMPAPKHLGGAGALVVFLKG